MAKIDRETKKRMLSLIRQLNDSGVSIKEIQKQILKDFNISRCIRTLEMYREESYRDEFLKRLAKDDATMKRWLAEASPNKISDSEQYAETLGELFKGNLDNDDFNSISKNVFASTVLAKTK